ncbi:tail completion protein gp17 [Paraburkholderia terrae]|uniref:tail completion protein gp17 n=1 Tax=Paraburkholderia terrae TaxID=311230 RepID=UPI00296B5485|nr:DUF3168 domain-containing protein [Paraburkholderia terrae]MDW3655146.1 DUF3168 domain-containing protein [Paraburkholderia terrae]
MSTIEEQLVAQLAPLVNGAIFPDSAAQTTPYPYLVYTINAGRVENVLESPVPPIDNTVFEINCWAATRGDSIALAALVTTAMQDWQDSTISNRKVTGDHGLYEADIKAYRIVQEYSVWHY